MFNLVFNGKVINKTPLSLKAALYQRGLVIINYGYSPEIKPA